MRWRTPPPRSWARCGGSADQAGGRADRVAGERGAARAVGVHPARHTRGGTDSVRPNGFLARDAHGHAVRAQQPTTRDHGNLRGRLSDVQPVRHGRAHSVRDASARAFGTRRGSVLRGARVRHDLGERPRAPGRPAHWLGPDARARIPRLRRRLDGAQCRAARRRGRAGVRPDATAVRYWRGLLSSSTFCRCARQSCPLPCSAA